MLSELPIDARRAALIGTRCLMAAERWSALLTMLTAANVVSEEQVRAMTSQLSKRLIAHASGELESEWQVHPGELRIEAARYAAISKSPAREAARQSE